jgi:hypothetical protein
MSIVTAQLIVFANDSVRAVREGAIVQRQQRPVKFIASWRYVGVFLWGMSPNPTTDTPTCLSPMLP